MGFETSTFCTPNVGDGCGDGLLLQFRNVLTFDEVGAISLLTSFQKIIYLSDKILLHKFIYANGGLRKFSNFNMPYVDG